MSVPRHVGRWGAGVGQGLGWCHQHLGTVVCLPPSQAPWGCELPGPLDISEEHMLFSIMTYNVSYHVWPAGIIYIICCILYIIRYYILFNI